MFFRTHEWKSAHQIFLLVIFILFKSAPPAHVSLLGLGLEVRGLNVSWSGFAEVAMCGGRGLW